METALSSLRESLEQTSSPLATSSLLTLGEKLQGEKRQIREGRAFCLLSGLQICEIESPAHAPDQRHPEKPYAGEICDAFRITLALAKFSGGVDWQGHPLVELAPWKGG